MRNYAPIRMYLAASAVTTTLVGRARAASGSLVGGGRGEGSGGTGGTGETGQRGVEAQLVAKNVSVSSDCRTLPPRHGRGHSALALAAKCIFCRTLSHSRLRQSVSVSSVAHCRTSSRWRGHSALALRRPGAQEASALAQQCRTVPHGVAEQWRTVPHMPAVLGDGQR
ncbi:hypothetical protein CBR_g20359 [Chara braunii]|uniref:Uncharacterized protein n=1 Tax=Chara braunii TaxID=69332 RepID=A0A388JU42_CHABU|nr:hypothetical protein CBR_g20359 [Chara braunii]|eukprot:GBG61324.1 hypothetical protein CBR_g20359 [Chara braunii]